MPVLDTHLLLRAFCDELARCGMRLAATSPGSRNTPLLLALARESRLRTFSHIDERDAGFFALGAAKASGVPVAVTCTSGTAAANLAPAVIEAFHAQVPLVVLTADRPPELREIGAGQTIDQLRLFGTAVKWFFDVGIHEATPERLRWIRTLGCRAFFTAVTGPAGPVHLNFPLREPLVPVEDLPADPLPGRAGGRPWVSMAGTPAGTAEPAPAASRPLIVAGAGGPGDLAEQAAAAAIPLLSDPPSGERRGPAAIAHYDLLLRDPEFVAAHRPDLVIRVGELPTSKPLRRWLAGLGDVAQVVLDPYRLWLDPDSVVSRRVSGLALPEPTATGDEWLRRWREADARVAAAIAAVLGEELSEPQIAARLSSWLPPEATLFVASSMPIRDVEAFLPVRGDPPRVLSNRGANGIDGTVSAAFGAAVASPGPVVLMIGDVALAHDIGGLMSARRLGLALTILLLNNDGGGIFHFLPVAAEPEVFQEHVTTAHGLDFAHAGALYGCGYEQPTDLGTLQAAVTASIHNAGTTIIAMRTDRVQNLELHRRVAQAAAAALAAG